MGFRIFFYRISKFIWGMSLADRPIICKTLQFLVTNIILSTWIQDSRLRKKKTSVKPLWIQDSRFKAQKNLLQPNLFGFKIQDSRLRKNFFNPTSLDSRLKAQKKLLQSNLFGFKIQDGRLKAFGFKFFLESWILNLEPYLLGFKKSFWDLESWILNPILLILNLESYPLGFKKFFGILNLESYPLGFKKSFWDLESWILNPTPLDSRSCLGIVNLESWIPCTQGRVGWEQTCKNLQFLITKKCPKF